MLKGCHRKEEARRLSSDQAFPPNPCIDMPWRSAGCSKLRIITDLRCPPGNMLSATLSRRTTTRGTDPITDESHRVYSCITQTWIHTHANELYSCAKLWFMSSWLQGWRSMRGKQHGGYISELFEFLPSPAECREERQVGHTKDCYANVNSPFPCIHLVKTCTQSRFQKPDKMQWVGLHLLWRSTPHP